MLQQERQNWTNRVDLEALHSDLGAMFGVIMFSTFFALVLFRVIQRSCHNNDGTALDSEQSKLGNGSM